MGLLGEGRLGHRERFGVRGPCRQAPLLRPAGDRRRRQGQRVHRQVLRQRRDGDLRRPELGGRAPARGKLLSIRVELATTDAAGDATFDPRWHYNHELVDVSRFRTFRQVAGGWGYQGYAILGIGTRARLPFRVFTLDGPGSGSRLVIDVAHKW
ncbi:AMIN-like domain-containing (lipo)protein [Cellulomonas soli]